jgi:adenylate cyclase
MRAFSKYSMRLKPSILTVFLLLTVPMLTASIVVNYVSNDRLARDSAMDLIARFRTDGLTDVQAIFTPIQSLIRAGSTLGEEEPRFYESNRSIRYFLSMLKHSERIVSVYVGLKDGSFRQARRVDPTVLVQKKLPPVGSKYAFRWIEAPVDGASVDHYLFLDADGRELGSSEEATTYDPRARGWYRNTVAAGSLYITDPDVFFAFGLIGFTVAAPFSVDGRAAGVVAADMTLDDLGSYLADRKISSGTLSYILDRQGRVLASSDHKKTARDKDGRVELRHISDSDDDLPALAYGARPRRSVNDALYSFFDHGKEYIASISPLGNDFGKSWQLFIVTPVADFTGPYQRHNDYLLALGSAALLIEVVIIYLLAGILSRPLETMAFKVGRIRDLSGEVLPPVKSRIREISVLGRAIDTLDTTLRSFASFVPIGLVRQLLESDQKLEPGGHSRFLTVFFSDLEGFSAMSEELPSQELLLRVSAYLGVVTHAVNAERGTIDKFMGDGVMAFWGAPVLLEDHAWRSCVAAMRIQQQMVPLNEEWIGQGLRPLQVRIGIHSDAVMVGNIGSVERLSYTVMGDGVNVASRLEGVNKEFKTGICISQSVYKEAGERLCVRPIDEVVVRGRRSKIVVYELLGVYGSDPDLEPPPQARRLAELSLAAYKAKADEQPAVAIERYEAILSEFPDDAVSRQQIERLRA